MRVLIDQQFHLGHHYQYIAHLLPELAATADDVVVAITPEGHESVEFKTFLAPFSDRVRFDTSLPPARPWLPMKERWRVHNDLRALVRRTKPDYVLIPSADAQATAMGMFRMAGLGSVPGRIPCEVGIHFGAGREEGDVASRLKDQLNVLNLRVANLNRVHVVNFLFYEAVRDSGRRGRFSLMPHPVVQSARMSRQDARSVLGLPTSGRYIGLAASIDSRKAVRELIAAFRAVSKSDERLLLAGWMNDTHRRMIDDQFGDVLKDGRLLLLDRFLTPEEFQAALAALDVVCTPYPEFAGLSSTLLEGVAAGRPILANRYGWSHAIIERFGLGWTCNVRDHTDFSRSLRLALDKAPEYRETEAISRLLAFHSTENFARHWVEGVARANGRSVVEPKRWEWVMGALAGSSARTH